ncbi:ABC transporter permease subunit [Jiangella mangrovi]|uniref:ABC-type sugar transport system permease subunit n=1 Tax=Jiangella mangrovi TaxID=1524084 RepID=A0A7W9LNH7_9ACTN|nr:ABC-type sugar transport system permease subunit [Jiangella mangrovi]
MSRTAAPPAAPPAARPPAAGGRPGRRRWSPRAWSPAARLAAAFLIPAVVLYLVFVLVPLVQSVWLSLHEWDGVNPVKTFVGLANYADLLDDRLFGVSVRNTLLWVGLGTAASLAVSLGLALLAWGTGRGFAVFRTLYFMPQVLPTVVVGIVWGWIYHPSFGVLNRILDAVGLDSLQRGWLGDPDVAVYAILAASVWASIGLSFVIFSAALNNVSAELLDAAKVDGANAVQRFRHVIVPQLSHAVTLVTSLLLIHNFQAFDMVWVMTRGGPQNSTQLIATYTYQNAFADNQVGYGAALSVVLTMICLIVTVVFVRLRERTSEV